MFFICFVSFLIVCQACICCEQEAVKNNDRSSRSISALENKQKARHFLAPQYSQIKGYIAQDWLKEDHNIGQVNGVSIDDDGLIYVFHRADRVWNMNTFNNNNEFLQADLGPINQPTILVFYSNGTLVESRGKGLFYMPHGIFVDKYKNIWVTDVALHQVMKLPPHSDSPLLTLGKQFKPGQDTAHFCKPSSVAVMRETNDFFVADGYCNFRILKFSSKGVKLLEWGRSSALEMGHNTPGRFAFFIPHALTIVERENLICVADRENGRVLCYHAGNASYVLELSNPTAIGSAIYSVDYSPARGGQFFLINGPSQSNKVQGFVVSPNNQIVSTFGGSYFQELAHDIAVTNDSSAVYVGELDPPRISKFVFNSDGGNSNHNESSFPLIKKINNPSEEGRLTGAILITTSCFVFAAAIIVAAFIYTKNRKSGTYETTESLLTNQEA